MPVIEKYLFDSSPGPRPCQQSDLAPPQYRHEAEVIIHDQNGKERFLRKEHAAIALAHDHELLARAVIDLIVP